MENTTALQPQQHLRISPLVGLAVIFLVIGGFLGTKLSDADRATMATSPQTKSIESPVSSLRNDLNASFREHTALTLPVLEAHLSNSAQSATFLEALRQNTASIAEDIDAAYPGSKDRFTELWNGHIDHYLAYLNAVRANDEAGKQMAKQSMIDFSVQLSDFFMGLNPQLDHGQLKAGLVDHSSYIMSLIEGMVGGQQNTTIQTSRQAYDQMGELADMLAGGIVKQMPENY